MRYRRNADADGATGGAVKCYLWLVALISLPIYTSILTFRHRAGNEPIALMPFDLVLIVAMREKLSTGIFYIIFFIFEKIYFILAIYCTLDQLVAKFHLIIFF